MHKMTQAEFNTLKRNGIGQLVVPDYTDCTEIDFHDAHMVVFGRFCELGDGANLGDRCKLDKGCKLGYTGENAVAYCWIVWVKGWQGDTVIRWIN